MSVEGLWTAEFHRLRGWENTDVGMVSQSRRQFAPDTDHSVDQESDVCARISAETIA